MEITIYFIVGFITYYFAYRKTKPNIPDTMDINAIIDYMSAEAFGILVFSILWPITIPCYLGWLLLDKVTNYFTKRF